MAWALPWGSAMGALQKSTWSKGLAEALRGDDRSCCGMVPSIHTATLV